MSRAGGRKPGVSHVMSVIPFIKLLPYRMASTEYETQLSFKVKLWILISYLKKKKKKIAGTGVILEQFFLGNEWGSLSLVA